MLGGGYYYSDLYPAEVNFSAGHIEIIFDSPIIPPQENILIWGFNSNLSGTMTSLLLVPPEPDVPPETNEPPVILALSTDPAEIWSPNHKEVDVNIQVVANDPDGQDGIISMTYSVVDEYGEYEVTGILPSNGVIILDAERDGNDKDGRVYTVTVTVEDSGGLTDSKSTEVIVLHDKGNN